MDRIDHALLDALQNDARLSNKELAAAVGLAPSSCLERVRKLRSDGVIRRFTADVDIARLGIGIEAMVRVRFGKHDRALLDAFREAMLRLDPVVTVYQMSGEDDFLVHVAVGDVESLRDVAMDHIASQPGVHHVETAVIFAFERKAFPITKTLAGASPTDEPKRARRGKRQGPRRGR